MSHKAQPTGTSSDSVTFARRVCASHRLTASTPLNCLKRSFPLSRVGVKESRQLCIYPNSFDTLPVPFELKLLLLQKLLKDPISQKLHPQPCSVLFLVQPVYVITQTLSPSSWNQLSLGDLAAHLHLTLFLLYRTVPFRVSSETRSVNIQPTYREVSQRKFKN